MSADALEVQVVEFIATAAEVEPDKVLPTSRLWHDLGIDGDDAVELFDGLHRRFGADLTHICEHWNEHFGSEGLPLSVGLVAVPAAIAGGCVAAAASGVVGNVGAISAGLLATALLIAAWRWISRKLGLTKEPRPITVAEVVEAVRAGSRPHSMR